MKYTALMSEVNVEERIRINIDVILLMFSTRKWMKRSTVSSFSSMSLESVRSFRSDD